MFKLYVKDGCPYCEKVLDAVAGMDLTEGEDFEIVDAPKGTPGREELLKLGGKHQVPFLVDGETSMYESDDIVAYLQETYG